MRHRDAPDAEILAGCWRFVSHHPEWNEESQGWEADVAWYAVATATGLVLIDPLVDDWAALDGLISDRGGCVAVVRTSQWHERTVAAAAGRYGTAVWTEAEPAGLPTFPAGRDDEIVVWLPEQRALLTGDVLLRTAEGELRLCPESWLEDTGGLGPVRAALGAVPALPIEHVLVSHGPLVLGDGDAAFGRAVAA